MARPCLRAELALLHPAWISGAILLAFNDHVLKGAGMLPSSITGKLSDFAGLFVAPALLAAIARFKSPKAWGAGAIAIGLVFSALQLSTSFAHTWTALFAALGIPFAIWADPTDLIALPMLAVAWWTLRSTMSAASSDRPVPAPSRAWYALAAAGLVLCAGSSPWPTAAPAVNGHDVFVEHHEGALFAVDTTRGTLRSRIPTQGSNVFPPTVFQGLAYWVDDAGRVMAASVAPPHNRWVLHPGDGFGRFADVAAVDEFRLYLFVFAEPSVLVVIDRSTGVLQWSLSVESLRYPVVSVSDDTALFVNGTRLFALDARTGATQWVFEAGDDLGRPTVTGERIHVADDGGMLRELDLARGTERWQAMLEGRACASFYPIAVDGSTAFVCADGDLHAFDLSARKSRWSHSCLGAAIVDNAVACVDGDKVRAFDRATGAPRWQTEVDETIWTHPVSGDGMVFVRNHVGKLYALTGATGALAWTLDMEEGHVTTGAPR